MLIVTTDTISGYEIIDTLGLVISIREFQVARPRKALSEAVSLIVAQAKARGADAIVALRVNSVRGEGISGIIVYGTAVKLKKIK